MPADELRECPWPECGWAVGEEPVLRYGQSHLGDYGVGVKCPCCGMRGPVCSDSERAQAMWNALPRRALPADVREVLIGLLRGTDEYWETTTEGQEVLTRARAILARYGEVKP